MNLNKHFLQKKRNFSYKLKKETSKLKTKDTPNDVSGFAKIRIILIACKRTFKQVNNIEELTTLPQVMNSSVNFSVILF